MLKINVYAEDRGWLFEDLKQHFEKANCFGRFEVVASDQPLAMADAWVALRTKEGDASPDITRTVICIHDLFCEQGMYQQGGSRQCVRSAGAIVLSHPDQRRILGREGISLQGVLTLERPLGALTMFQPRQHSPDRFCPGWVGRNHARKQLGWFVEAIQELGLGPDKLRVALIGAGLGDAVARLRAIGVDCNHYDKEAIPISAYPQLYQSLDCMVITSSTEAGPLPLFEALATGLPVVSTPVGWAPYFSQQAPRYVRLAYGPLEITACLKQLECEKEEMFNHRFDIASLVDKWRLDTWLFEVLDLAGSLAASSLRADQGFERERIE